MNARDEIVHYIGEHGGVQPHIVDSLLDAYRAERDTEVVAWLTKKAREFRANGETVQADTAALLASKVERGAVRANNLRGFFEPRRTYQRGRWHFECLAVAPSPFNGEGRAVGFLYRPGEPATATALDPDDWAHGEWLPGEDGAS